MSFELSAVPESRVCQWVEQVTNGVGSCFEFGAGLFTYIKAAQCEKKGGCELFKPYLEAVHADPDCATIEVVGKDMRTFMPVGYEMALFVDSLEHIKKAEAVTLIKKCQERFSKIAVFIPEGKHDNPVCDENKHQAHLSAWSVADMEKLGFVVDHQPAFHNNNPPEKQGAMFAMWAK